MEQPLHTDSKERSPAASSEAKPLSRRRRGVWFRLLAVLGVLSLIATSSPIMRTLYGTTTDVATALSTGAITPNATDGPRYFVLVQGCIPPTPCERDSIDEWGEYGALIQELFDTQGWGKGADNGSDQSFEDWAATHVRYVGSPWFGPGEDGLEATVSDIVASDPEANVHILGHSIAGGAIARYLLDLSENGGPERSAIKSAVMVDSPLLVTVLIVPMVGGRVWQLGEKAAEMGIIPVSVDTPNDFVGAFSVEGVLEEGNPSYPEASGLEVPKRQKYFGIALPPSRAELEWHDHSSRHVATQLRDFLMLEWK